MIIDIVFLLFLLLAFLKGINKGFFIALFSFFGFYIGIAAGIKFSTFTADYLTRHSTINADWLPFLAFILVFLLTLIALYFIGKLLQKTAEVMMLGWLNKIGGVCLYMIIYSLIYSSLLYYSNKLNLIPKHIQTSSKSYAYVSPLATEAFNWGGKIIPFFKNSFEQLDVFFKQNGSK